VCDRAARLESIQPERPQAGRQEGRQAARQSRCARAPPVRERRAASEEHKRCVACVPATGSLQTSSAFARSVFDAPHTLEQSTDQSSAQSILFTLRRTSATLAPLPLSQSPPPCYCPRTACPCRTAGRVPVRRAPFPPEQRLVEVVSVPVSCESRQVAPVCSGSCRKSTSSKNHGHCQAPATRLHTLGAASRPWHHRCSARELLVPDQDVDTHTPPVHCYNLPQLLGGEMGSGKVTAAKQIFVLMAKVVQNSPKSF